MRGAADISKPVFRCGGCVRQRIIRAFLIEEQKIVKRVLNDQAKK